MFKEQIDGHAHRHDGERQQQQQRAQTQRYTNRANRQGAAANQPQAKQTQAASAIEQQRTAPEQKQPQTVYFQEIDRRRVGASPKREASVISGKAAQEWCEQ